MNKENKLYAIVYKDGETKYFTSLNRAGNHIGVTAPSVSWAIAHENTLVDKNDREFCIKVVDGSEIKWKDINKK